MTRLLQVARPKFLLSGLALFVFGASWAVLLGAPFSLSRALLGYLVLLPAHLSVSYSNDYFDVDVDKYGKPTMFSGGSGVLIDHPELREPARWTAIALILCSLALGIVYQIAFSFSTSFSVLVLVGNLLGWFYSAPPLRLAYRGLGELSMICSVGLLIPGLGYLVSGGKMVPDTLLFVVPLMLYGLSFSLGVEIPDMESDRLGNKRTWVATHGRVSGFSLIAVSFLLATVYFSFAPCFTSRAYPVDLRVLGIASLIPLGAGCIGLLKKPLERRSATRLVNGIMIAFAAFCILADGYMLYLAFSMVPNV